MLSFFFGRRIFLLATFLGLTVAPYVWTNPERRTQVQKSWHWLKTQVSASRSSIPLKLDLPGEASQDEAVSLPATKRGAPVRPVRLTGPRGQLVELFRFDISPRWISEHWSRVSTVASTEGLQGMRVPLVTGTEVTDLAGSLTYYFDSQKRVRRITFDGHTGDESELVQYASGHFKLRQEPSLDAAMYISRWNAAPISVLLVRHAPVMRAAAPHSNLEVKMELNAIWAGQRLSSQFAELVSYQRHQPNTPALH